MTHSIPFERIDQPAPDTAYREAVTVACKIAESTWGYSSPADELAHFLLNMPLDTPRAKLMSAVFNAPKGTFGALVASRIASL